MKNLFNKITVLGIIMLLSVNMANASIYEYKQTKLKDKDPELFDNRGKAMFKFENNNS